MGREVTMEDIDQILMLISQGKDPGAIAQATGLPMRVITAVILNKYRVSKGKVIVLI